MSLLIGLSNSSHKSDHEVQLDSVAVINWLGNRGKPVRLRNFGQNAGFCHFKQSPASESNPICGS